VRVANDQGERNMKVLVIGATGQTGRLVMKRLLDHGHEVTAFARQPSAITEKHDRLRVVQGDVRDARLLDQAIKGHGAIVATFGPRSLAKTDLQEVFMRNLVASMTNNGVKRLVNLSVWGSGGKAVPPRNLIARYFFLPIVLRHLLADKRRGEVCLFESDLDYTNVCPAFLKNSPARGGVRASIDGKGLQQIMHREDLAEFMVEQLSSAQWVRKCVVVGY
jgi:putative NADH-flavin reductase